MANFQVVLNDDQVKGFSKYLIYNHAADQGRLVLMGMNTALKNFKTLDNALDILDSWREFMASVRDLREKMKLLNILYIVSEQIRYVK